MADYINERIRKYRRKAKITQREMARRLGMSYSKYSRLEREGTFKAQMIVNIAFCLGIEPRLLVISGMMEEYENIAN